MNQIVIRDAKEHNLKNVTVHIPLRKLVSVVGKSGSGKSSFVYDVLYKASQGKFVDAKVGVLPRISIIEQRVKPLANLSLGETNFKKLEKILEESKKGEMLIVDEPCAGMAHEDRQNILRMLKQAVKKGISVIVVEHSKDVILGSDYVIEFGPESGAKGGEAIFEGALEKFKKAHTSTSEYVFSDKAGLIDYQRSPNEKAKKMQRKTLTIKGIDKNSLKNFDVSIPLGNLVCISGKMGTGKSTLLSVVYGALFKGSGAWKLRQGYKTIEGKANVRRSYFVDQSSLSSISTSTPATYVGVWDAIRDAYANLPESRKLRLKKADFCFYGKRTDVVQKKIGRALFQGKSIDAVSEMTIDDVSKLFAHSSLIVRKLGFLQEVGLGYLTLGQKSNTLSGGEAQRVRLAKILSKKLGDRCIYILDIPSRGLHLSNLPSLMKVLQKIIDKNNTVLIAENREEIIKNCDATILLK
jgi:excinuclease ABC subunit A